MHDGVVWVLNEVSVGRSVKLFLYCQGLLKKLRVEGGWRREERGGERGGEKKNKREGEEGR